ncbi:hypothetical protein ACHWQZ_G002242 [Mnemiopsis leidyi]
MIAKRHPNDFSDIEIEPNNEQRHENQLSEVGLLQMLVQRRTSLSSTLWKSWSWKKLLQLIRSSFYYADRNVSRRVQTFGKENASAQHMYDDKYFATGDNFNALANLFRVGHFTVRTIICEMVKFPSTEEDFYKPDIC